MNASAPDVESNPAPHPLQCVAAVVENRAIARDTFLARLHAPEVARAIRPGQFVMVRPAGTSDPLLGRAFALYEVDRDRDGTPSGLRVVYHLLGRGTRALARLRPSDEVAVWGPLGNGFGPPPAEPGPVLMVAGGIGQTPFLALPPWWRGQREYGGVGADDPGWNGRALPDRPFLLYYGVRSADLLAGLDDFEAAGVPVEIATDDGSAGHRGRVTDLLERRLADPDATRPARVIACGPPPMLKAAARIAAEAGIPCELSIENHMACGFGACFSCVAPLRMPDGSIDLRRVCVDGPIVDAARLVWED